MRGAIVYERPILTHTRCQDAGEADRALASRIQTLACQRLLASFSVSFSAGIFRPAEAAEIYDRFIQNQEAVLLQLDLQ